MKSTEITNKNETQEKFTKPFPDSTDPQFQNPTNKANNHNIRPHYQSELGIQFKTM